MKHFTPVFLLLFASVLYSQTIPVNWHPSKVLTYKHSVISGETLYGIAQKYQVATAEIAKLNQIEKNQKLGIGQHIFIPFDSETVSLVKKENHQSLVYTVKKSETLFKIATAFAHKSVADVMKLNGKSDYTIQPGDQLILGYVAIKDGQPKEKELELVEEFEELAINLNNPTNLESIVLFEKKSFLTDSLISQASKSERGVAFWDQSDYTNTDYVVMHSTAKINSDITLYNPMLRKKVTARVISSVPKNLYPSNIDVVISPLVASALGAHDRKFLVDMTFIE